MDAYDIFKKLTKGLKFKNSIIGDKLSKDSSETLEKVKKEEEDHSIKDELGDEELSSADAELSDQVPLETDASGDEEQFQLLEGVTVADRKKRKKKEKTESLKQKLEIEEQNRFRNAHGIRVVGRAVPPALPDLEAAAQRYGVSAALLDTVRRCGYSEPTPVQRQAWPCMFMKRQILACAPTGSGKTAAFLVPVIHSLGQTAGGPAALVLCPTRELARQTYREALRLTAGTALRCSVLNKITDAKLKERESTFKKSDIVMTTPNRLCYLLNQENTSISLDKVVWLVVDEADKLFEGSETQEADFRQQMERVLAACGGRERRVAMFSATHTPAVARWCRRHLRGLLNITVGQRNTATQLVEQELLYCGNEAGKLLAFRQLVQKGLKPPVLVFVQSKERAKQLFKELLYDGINVEAIHADRTQAQRDNAVRSFRLGRIWVLVCTELLARGIDFCGVSLVVNYDFPPSAIAYIHRIGRAGRAGQRGRAVTFFTQDDIGNLRSIAAVMKSSGCAVPAYMLQLRQDRAARRRLAQRAPRRPHISTAPLSRDKRKLEAEKSKEENSKGNKIDNPRKQIENSKKSKLRKTDQQIVNSKQPEPRTTRNPKNVNKKKLKQKISKVAK